MASEHLVSISNPLVTLKQIQDARDEIPKEYIDFLRYQSALLTQSAGILLKLPQEVIAQAVVILQRFYLGGGSYTRDSIGDCSAAALYLTAKLSSHPQTTRALLNVYAYLRSTAAKETIKPEPETYTLSEGDYYRARERLMRTESSILKALAYDTHVVIPHTLALTYLQTLSLIPPAPTEQSYALVRRTIAHLNSALLSPQLLYLTHQPHALAVSAIYLAAKEVGVKLAEKQWWEIWDVDREELGFLVVSFGSLEGFVRLDVSIRRKKAMPWTSKDVRDGLDDYDA